MRKTMSRLCTAVLMVMLLCSLTIMSVSAANEGPTCDGNHKGWTELTGNTITASGNYYLTKDRTGANGLQVNSGVTATLCLCGHKLETTTNTVTVGRLDDQTDSETGVVINPKGSAELTLVNCVTTGEENGILKRTTTASDGNGRTITLFMGSTLNIGDNVHLDGATTDYVVLLNGASVVNMYGGSIRNNANTKWGFGQVGSEAQFNLYGGEVSGNTGTANGNGGGGVRVNSGGTFTMTGGTFQGTGNMIYGTSGAKVNISGGTVKHASATGNAFVVNNGATCNLSGSVTVYGKLYNLGTWNITGGRFNNDPSAVAATGLDASAVLKNTLSADYPYYLAGYTAAASDSCANGHEGWLDITKTGTITADGKYYLGAALTSPIKVDGDCDVTVCMNGHNIETSSQAIVAQNGAKLELVNCFGTGGNITYTGAFYGVRTDSAEITINENIHVTGSTQAISPVFVNGGTINMKGGSITGNTGTEGGGVILNNANSTFKMSGGTISGNTSGANGGGVYMKAGTFTMSGGEISGNTATQGGGVYVVGGTFEMTGGTIGGADKVEVKDGVATLTENTGNYATTNGGGVFVNGGMFKVSGDAQMLNNLCNAGSQGGVHIAYSGDMEMTGGTIAGANNALYSLGTKTVTVSNSTINGGVTTGTAGRVIELTNVDVSGNVIAHGDFVISGGKFGGKVYTEGAGTISVTGGQFSAKTDVNDLAGWLDEGVNMAEIWSDESDYVYYAGVDGFYTTGEHMDFGSSLALGLYLNDKPAEDYEIAVSGGYTAAVKEEAVTGSYIIFAEGIAAKAMDEKITYTIKKDGEDLFCKTVSVREAAEAWSNDDNTNDDTLVADMINYGREAQKTFLGEYKMDSLGDTDTVADWNVADGSGVDADHKDSVAVTLSLKDQIELNVYVNDVVTVEAGSTEGYVVEDVNGITRISFKDINVVDAHEAVVLNLSNGAEVKFSIADYCALAKDGAQKNLINALMKYIQSVCDYVK